MFSTEQWLQVNPRQQRARLLYGDILQPQLWEMGRAEAEARAIACDRWSPKESYWLYQPSSRQIL